MSKFQSYMTGPKWAGLKPFLYELAGDNNLRLTITGNDRGWFREAVYFEVEGDDQSIRNFNRQLEASIQAYEENREARKRA